MYGDFTSFRLLAAWTNFHHFFFTIQLKGVQARSPAERVKLKRGAEARH